MKNLLLLCLSTLILLLCQCNVNNSQKSPSSVADSISSPEEKIVQILVPDDFNPTIPISQLEKEPLRELIVNKYYSFKKKKNQRRLHDIQTGRELPTLKVLSLREEFENAASLEAVEWMYNRSSHAQVKINYKAVPENSNLAKVFFQQKFGLFVLENEKYCKEILDSIEKEEINSVKSKNTTNQEKYINN